MATKFKKILLGIAFITIGNISNPLLAQTTIEDCSIINLISTPEKYHEKRVRIIGYVVLEFEHQAIYLSENYAKRHLTTNGIWIFLEDMNKSIQIPEKIEGGYYLIVGTFDKNMFGHGALYSGGITKIERFTRWSK